jgi:integrase
MNHAHTEEAPFINASDADRILGNKEQQAVSFADLTREYLPYAEANKAHSTTHRDKSRMRRLLRIFGNKKLSEITGREIERYMQERRKTAQPATVNRELALLKHMLRKAVDWEYLQSNPARAIKLFKEPPGRIRWLNDGERERLLDECRRSVNPLLFSIVLTAIYTGMRKGELQRLTWDDVSFDAVIPIITVKHTKNNETRYIPISESLLPVLRYLFNAIPIAHYVFSKPDGTAYGDWRKSFTSACKRAGVKDFRFHDLRHTFASYLGMAGCNVFEIKALTGHKTLAMVARYTHISDRRLKVAVDSIDAIDAKTTQLLIPI